MAAKSPLDNVINLAKRRGFVFQAGEIYGGSRLSLIHISEPTRPY